MAITGKRNRHSKTNSRRTEEEQRNFHRIGGLAGGIARKEQKTIPLLPDCNLFLSKPVKNYILYLTFIIYYVIII